jgi:PH (Pleckstrin Homology) domain-containing protein
VLYERERLKGSVVGYIDHVLQPGEKIGYQGSVSWLILYLPAIILAVIGVVASALAPGWIIAAMSFFIIRRNTVEVNMDKIESVDVNQTLLGRIFDHGDVTIKGTGSTLEPLRSVDRPIAFRNEVTAR